MVPGAAVAEVLFGSPVPIGGLELAGEAVLSDGAAVSTRWTARVAGSPAAVHSMWWTAEPYYLYRVDLDAVGQRAGAGPAAGGYLVWVTRVEAPR